MPLIGPTKNLALPPGKKQILRGVYPEQKLQTLRFAQDDSEGLRMTTPPGLFSTNSYKSSRIGSTP
jgi:hypothetical protein